MSEEKKAVDKLLETLSNMFAHTPIKEIMSSPPIVVTRQTKVRFAKEIMRIKRISGIPVVNKDLSLAGILSIEDIIKIFENGSVEDCVEIWMTKNPIYLNENETIKQFLKINEKNKYGRYPVINNKNRIVGVVTKLDILQWMFKKLGYIYVHDKRREEALNKKYVSALTGEALDIKGVDFSYEINYESVEMIGLAATKLKKYLLSKEIKKDLVRKISIAAYEAEANVVIHSNSKGILYCWIKNDHIKILFEDYGTGIENLDMAMKEGFSTASENIREKGFGAGMGLPNIKRFSDKMTIISSPDRGVKVELLFYL